MVRRLIKKFGIDPHRGLDAPAPQIDNRVHHDLGCTVPFTKGGTDHVAVSGSLNLYDRRVRLDELDRRRVYSAGTPF